ncbi:hypothetical protein niasHT_008277 [Heterodera trifolii]|uniref:Uncharacterized protein n=1 Tax=Heterodera trifolii TaxID=157864 RepID=A0ABD2M1A5_9BILA
MLHINVHWLELRKVRAVFFAPRASLPHPDSFVHFLLLYPSAPRPSPPSLTSPIRPSVLRRRRTKTATTTTPVLTLIDRDNYDDDNDQQIGTFISILPLISIDEDGFCCPWGTNMGTDLLFILPPRRTAAHLLLCAAC